MMNALVRQKIVDSLASPVREHTRRDIRLPGVPGKAVAVIGMRRTGKTTLLWQVLADRLRAGVPREGLLYFSFEDERLSGMTAAEMGMVVEEYYNLNPGWRDSRRATFLFDEVQAVPGWEVFVRRILDSEKIDLFLSGSSAKLLSREVATSMRGRAMEALVHPFSFREYLRHRGREPSQPSDRLTKAARSSLQKDLAAYLMEGGFPESQQVDPRDRFDLLRGYVDVALLRDVIERHAVSNPVTLRWMVRHLLGNAGGSFSLNKFEGDLRSQGIPVAKDTLHAYLAYLEDAFLVRTVSVATDSERRRMVNPRKAYPVDPALIPIFDRSGKANTGHALETCVLLELERRGVQAAYVRTKGGFEVDFLARSPAAGEALIQVCTDLDDPETFGREARSLVEAAAEHPLAKPWLIVLNPPVTSPKPPKGVGLVTATDWLLGGAGPFIPAEV